METKKPLFYLLAGLMGGCVPVLSLHPLYTKENVIFKQELLGTWADPNSPGTTWQFKRADKDKNIYKLVFSDEDGRKGLFDTHLVELKGRLFLDLYPADFPCDLEDPNKVDWPYNSFFLVPVHTFIKVDSIEPTLKMRLTIDDKVEQLLKENPKAVKHTVLEDKSLLTASTKELQAFVLKYADDERLFGESTVLKRTKAKDPQEPGDKQSGDSAGE